MKTVSPCGRDPRKNRARWLGLALVALALAGSACSPDGLGRGSGQTEKAPPLDLDLLRGGRVSLESLRGKMVLIDFWATWCAPCVLEIPELNAFYAAHRSQGVELLAIAVDGEENDALAEWVEDHGLRYPVALGTEAIASEFGAFQFPYHVLLSPDGRILERLSPGFHDRGELRDLVARHRGS